MVHTLRLDNYYPTPRKLVLGTNSSFGTESIKIERGAGWDGLNLTATWHIPGREEPLRVALLDGDAMDVPPEVTKEAKDGVLVLAGLASGVQRASCNVEYLILEQAGVYGGADAEPTPELAAQVLEAALQAKVDAEAAAEDAAAAKANADKAQADAEKAQQAAVNAAADAAKAGPYAKAAQTAQEAAESARDEAIAAQRAAENAAAAAAASKSAADTLATEAARAAKAAEDSKAAATNAADLAGENATAASKAAATATAAANDAGQSASDAAASKAAAETAAKAAQEAQAAAAAAKADAVKAQTTAQTAAKSAQDAQAAAEKARDDAKTAQKGAEAARDTAAKSAEAAAKSEANAKQSADTLAESVENVVANTAAVAELKEKKAEIDDTVVGANTWSSKHIIDMLCPPLEESGNPVVCYPVAGYPLGVKASWEPVQEGTGTPYPAGSGKNLFNPAWMPEKALNHEVTWTITPDGTVTANGTANGTTYYNASNFSFPAGTYTISPMSDFRISILNMDADNATIAAQTVGKPCSFIVETDIQNATLFFAASGTLDNVSSKPQIEKGATATAYEPYANIRPIKGRDSVTITRQENNQVIVLTMPETVYGGEVDAVIGEGNKNIKIITLDGNKLKFSQSGNYLNLPMHSAPGILASGIICCSHFNSKIFSVNTTYEFCFVLASDIAGVFASTDDLNAYLAAQYAAETPVQICYKLAEPVPFTATGAQPIPALAGVNTVLTDADSATVTGRADPIKKITDLEAAVASIN